MRVLILGGGPAGITAALQAREFGSDVTLIEAAHVGGTSVNEGPAPIRTLARAARLMRDTSAWSRFGIIGERPRIDLKAALENAERVARYAHDRKGLSDFIRDRGVELIEGRGPGTFCDDHTLGTPDGKTWSGDRIIICVGGHAGSLAVPGAGIALTYADLRSLNDLPQNVVVIGGADTGCQLASVLRDFGCRVTLLEAAARLLPRGDEDVSMTLTAAFQTKGIVILTEVRLEALERRTNGIAIRYERGAASTEVSADAVFFAVGWPANLESLRLDIAGVKAHRGYIIADDHLRTTNPDIFAAGDVNGNSMLVQSARYEGRVAAENAILGPARIARHDVVPTGSFTDPEYASVGLTEAEGRLHFDCSVGVARYDDLLRAVADGHTEGFCKLIVDRRTRTILGGHVLGEYSTEVIQVVAACMSANLRIEQVAEMQLSFPTFTEGVGMAAQKIVRELGVGRLPQVWSSLSLRSADQSG